METRKCVTCEKTKPVDCFYPAGRTYRTKCKVCVEDEKADRREAAKLEQQKSFIHNERRYQPRHLHDSGTYVPPEHPGRYQPREDWLINCVSDIPPTGNNWF